MLFEMSKSSFDVVFWHDLIIGAWFEILIGKLCNTGDVHRF